MKRMIPFNKNTPVLLLIFNRPALTERLLEVLQKAAPSKLYIAADGPRNDAETELCNATRSLFDNLNWPCEKKQLFRTHNLGCKQAVSEAITWFFEAEECGIILEDDCLPSLSFFGFCSQLLERYKDDERIGHIAGVNFQKGIHRGDGDYYFSRLTHVWGWAGWRRVWKEYDADISSFPLFESEQHVNNSGSHAPFAEHWIKYAFGAVYHHQINTWDYQYAYLNLISNRLCIIPNKNLVSNIGVGESGTHTKDAHPFQNQPLEEMNTLTHPRFFMADTNADIHSQRIEYNIQTSELKKSIWKKLKIFK